jgi:hypothetical protein
MDERWLIRPDPKGLDDYWWYNDQLSERKRYLFMAAVGRRVAGLMTEPACIRAVEACEEYAEGVIDRSCFYDLCDEASSARLRCGSIPAVQAAHDFVVCLGDNGKLHECVEAGELAFGYVAAAQAGDLEPETTLAAWQALEQFESFRSGCTVVNQQFTAYCLDIFGSNPYELPQVDPPWRTDTVVSLARQMYESREFSAMPILADALQDAGCEHPDVLDHCRGSGPHVRGCWVVDLVLGKT